MRLCAAVSAEPGSRLQSGGKTVEFSGLGRNEAMMTRCSLGHQGWVAREAPGTMVVLVLDKSFGPGGMVSQFDGSSRSDCRPRPLRLRMLKN